MASLLVHLWCHHLSETTQHLKSGNCPLPQSYFGKVIFLGVRKGMLQVSSTEHQGQENVLDMPHPVTCTLWSLSSIFTRIPFFLPPHNQKSRIRLYQQYTPATLRGIIIPMRTTTFFDLIYKSNTTWFWTDIFILKKGYAHLHKTSQTGLHSGETSMYVLWSSLKQLPIWVVKVQIFQSNRNVTDLWWWLLWKLTY